MMHSRCLGPCSVKTEQYVLSFRQKVINLNYSSALVVLLALAILSPTLPYRVVALPRKSFLLALLPLSPTQQ